MYMSENFQKNTGNVRNVFRNDLVNIELLLNS